MHSPAVNLFQALDIIFWIITDFLQLFLSSNIFLTFSTFVAGLYLYVIWKEYISWILLFSTQVNFWGFKTRIWTGEEQMIHITY